MVPAQEPPPVRLRIDLSYDGSAFSGWAVQPGRRTVAEVVAVALGRALRLPGPPELTVAGRTDAGVHARGQVVHADVPASAWDAADPATERVTARLSGALPADVRVRAIGPAPDGFDARFSALWRRYSYRVCDDPAAADPLRRHETLWHFRRLDLDAMNEAALALLGERDFAAFCRRREGASTIRTLRALSWQRDGDGIAVASVVADAFCHNMVRSLVGALLAVGDARRPPAWPAAVLAAAARDPAVQVMPPHALCLEEVRYPPPVALAARAAETRRIRTPPDRPAERPHRPLLDRPLPTVRPAPEATLVSSFCISSRIRYGSGLLGKIRASGRKVGVIVHQGLPKTRNFPDVGCTARTTGTKSLTGPKGTTCSAHQMHRGCRRYHRHPALAA